MALRLLADADALLHVERLASLMQKPAWVEIWNWLNLELVHFHDFGLAIEASDLEVWQACQRFDLLLVTNNRNDDDADSLESVIRAFGTNESLPVFTFANLRRFQKDALYADTVVAKLYDYLLRIDELRGSGRVFLP